MCFARNAKCKQTILIKYTLVLDFYYHVTNVLLFHLAWLVVLHILNNISSNLTWRRGYGEPTTTRTSGSGRHSRRRN